MKLLNRILAPIALTLLSGSVFADPIEPSVAELKAEFMQTQNAKGFSDEATQAFIANAEFNQAVIDAMTKPWEAKPWHQYYPIFLTEKTLRCRT